jgi:bifunctional polynucleotide phosphatase/kinase
MAKKDTDEKGMKILDINGFNCFNGRHKIAAFDFDWTLVKPNNDNRVFPKDVNDWQWLRPNVPEIVRKFHEAGYSIMVFTNQTKLWKVDQLNNALSTLNIPIAVGIGLTEKYRKPNRILFDEVLETFEGQDWDREASFFVGDALGRKNDWSDSDKVFAESVGIMYKTPEDVFPYVKGRSEIDIKPISDQEIVMMVGYPGSGKSTIAITVFGNNEKYTILHGDDLKTAAKIKRETIRVLKEGKSVVIDATNPTVEKRSVYINLAKMFNVKTRCIHVNTSFDESLYRNNLRIAKAVVPKIAYYVYRKSFVPPNKQEGFQVFTVL